jgi:tetratricopeptide (TPR) repeat protein
MSKFKTLRTFKTLCVLLLFSVSGFAEDIKTNAQLQADVAKIDKSIKVTRDKMKEIKDVGFLPDLYFVLAELYVEKSRYLYTIARQRESGAKIEEIDFSESRKTKKQAIEIYQRIIESFPKSESLDRATFYMAHEYREIGATEEMFKTYVKLTTDYPKSQFWEESQLILGDYYLEQKKDPKLALEIYQKILARPINPFMPLARYKTGWCYINLEKFHEALLAFEGVLTIDSAASLDKLPDIYKKSDIRRDALIALVWPYSEEKKLEPFRADTLNYFESLSPNRPTLLKVLDKLTKRLLIKNKIEVAMPVYIRLIEITNDVERRAELTDLFYSALRKSKRSWPIEIIPEEITETLIRVRGSLEITPQDKVKYEKNFEIYLRDITTRLQTRAKASHAEKDYQNAIKGYEDYLTLFPTTRFAPAITLNLSESYFAAKKFARAGYYYEVLVNKTVSKSRKEVLDSAIQSYAFALKEPEKISKLELTESREGFRTTGLKFIGLYKSDPANAMIIFNIARTYYDDRDFDRAVQWFNSFINNYSTHKEVPTAGNLILDSYNQREDYEGLIRAGKSLVANRRINNPQFKKDVSEIIKNAEYRKIENAVGDPRSRDYAKKLLGFASKYSGSSIGDQALYEAFLSLKLKKDPQVYDPGEQLLNKHGDSKYAKEVVSAMGKMAINTSDYRRAAHYFEIFARKYPKDPSSAGLLKNAATMHELMGDYKEAAEDFRDLGPAYTESVARQFAASQDWSSLSQTLSARPINTVRGQYWLGLSLYRQNNFDQARGYLQNAASSKASDYEEKKMAAHSLYLLSTQALKDYQNIQLGAGQNEADLVKTKSAKLNQLTSQFNRVIAFGNGRWTIAALYQLGRANIEFGQFIMGAAVPPGLNASQQAQYKQLISQQATQYKSKAAQFFKACLENAEKSEVFSGFVRGCQSEGSQTVDEAIEEKQIARAGESAPPEAKEIRKKLFDTPKDISLLFQLAHVYIKSQDFSLARTIYSRILELKPGLSLAEAELGTTLLFMNDLEGAQLSFKQALSHNPKESTALWSLAAMYKMFGFMSKYKQVIPRAQKAGRPSGPIHPWVAPLLGS